MNNVLRNSLQLIFEEYKEYVAQDMSLTLTDQKIRLRTIEEINSFIEKEKTDGK